MPNRSRRGEGKRPQIDHCDPDGLQYYAVQSRITDPGRHSPRLTEFPRDIPTLYRAASGLVIHFRLDDLAGAGVSKDRLGEVDTRYAEAILSRLLELDNRAITERRAPSDRIVGCCRDFTVVFLSMARAVGIPARARVGFASYLFPEVLNDHEIAEVWDECEGRWRLVDPQIAEGHSDPHDGAPIDPLDVPRDRFLVAGEAWHSCQTGLLTPDDFVVHPQIDAAFMRGWPYLSHNLVFDLAALNKAEMLLWDIWGLAGKVLAEPAAPEEMDLLERVATLSRSPRLADVQQLYEDQSQLRVPEEVASFSPTGITPRMVTVYP